MNDKFETKSIELEDGRTISVDALPLEIREFVKLFDRISKDLEEATYKRDVLAIAAQGWRNKIMVDIMSVVPPEKATTKPASETPDVWKMTVNNMLDNVKLVEEYKKYIQNKVLNNSFDFDTWCQHQFGESPKNISVNPEIKFNLVSKPEHK